MKFFSFLLLGLNFAYSSEISLVNNKNWYRGVEGGTFVTAEYVRMIDDNYLYRELNHPSRMGGIVSDGEGNPSLGLLVISEKEDIIKATATPLVDALGQRVDVGNWLEIAVATGRRLKTKAAKVLFNYKCDRYINGKSLVTIDLEFAKLVEKKGLTSAIEQMGYFSLRLVTPTNGKVVASPQQ